MKFFVTVFYADETISKELTMEEALEFFAISVKNGFPVTIEAVK
jgi:hypothetical protein